MPTHSENTRDDAPVVDRPASEAPEEGYISEDIPGSFPLRQVPWRDRLRTEVDPDYILFGVSAARFGKVLIASTSGLVDPESQLRGLLGATFDFAESDPHAFTTILALHHAELTRGDVDPTPLEVFKHVLRDGMQEGVFWQNDTALIAAWVVALIQRTVVLAQTRRFEGTAAEVRAMAIDAAVRLVKAPHNLAGAEAWEPFALDVDENRETDSEAGARG